ncbi:hypothetical protein DAEQUDRAFT_726077 [Daedalea quercina L-15889]|uniref:Uncharacterized protein n=1 Tax=Daedalea quercina L-15889 TaxID=1314783 RepID=A0A165QQ73_9APHY|nr:hypothetical protein DAEQUDRAFT_726077 [Daedalea quercina L-15889]
MEVCPPELHLELPPLIMPSLSASSSASSSSSSSLVNTPPDEDTPMVDVASPDAPVNEPPPTARRPAQYESVVQGRDDEAKEAAYALLGLSKAPPKPVAPTDTLAQKAQPIVSQPQPANPPPQASQVPVIIVPEIVITPPEKELAIVDRVTALLAGLTLRPALFTDGIVDEDMLSGKSWAGTLRQGDEEDLGNEEEDEVARMLVDLVDEMSVEDTA